MPIQIKSDMGEWTYVRFRSLRAVKSWATRCKHVYQVQADGMLKVSTAGGSIYRYRETAKVKS